MRIPTDSETLWLSICSHVGPSLYDVAKLLGETIATVEQPHEQLHSW